MTPLGKHHASWNWKPPQQRTAISLFATWAGTWLRKSGAWLFIKIAREAVPDEFHTLYFVSASLTLSACPNLIWFDGSQHLKAHAKNAKMKIQKASCEQSEFKSLYFIKCYSCSMR
jgi:hypothetical protein